MLAVLTAVLVATTSPAMAADTSSVNWDSEAAPNGVYEGNMTKDVHDMSWGQSAEAVRKFENDSGVVTKIEGEVNTSYDNPYSFVFSDVNVSDWGEFPHDKPNVSALDASEWSKDVSGSAGSATISDVETAPGVEAVNFATSSQTSGDTAFMTFSNFSVTSDEAKRFGQVVYDVNTVDSGAYYEVRVVDEDGDYKVIVNDTETGDGFVDQEQLGNLATEGSGDGTFDNIQKVEVYAIDGDVDMTIAGLNAEKKSAYDLGSMKKDTDSDDSLESVDINSTHTGGEVSLSGLDTLGPAFADAEINDLTVPVNLPASMAGEDDSKLVLDEDSSVDGGNYPGFKGTATVYVRMEVPSQYDLSFSGMSLNDTQSVTSGRLMSVQYAEGTGDTEFENISDASWSDITSSYGSKGDTVVVDDTVQPGTPGVLKVKMKLTPGQFDAIEGSTSGGGGGGATGAGGWGNIPVIGGLIVAAVAFLKRLG
ncbi:hypothetical protein VB773_14210 [Haloarculaceae archaeon H-GB2-1]|nr:hypothetical protein [Haloarculaceae archaeon H-GB2-1]